MDTGSKNLNLESVLLDELPREDSVHWSVQTDEKCWAISNLNTLECFVVIDRLAVNQGKLPGIVEAISEGDVHELIHQICQFGNPLRNEVYVFTITECLLKEFFPEYWDKRKEIIYPNFFEHSELLRSFYADVRLRLIQHTVEIE